MRSAPGFHSCACPTFAPADSARGHAALPDPVMEVVTFRLLPGISPAEFVSRARDTKVAVAAQPGFVRRTLLCDDTGLWSDMILWRGLADATAAAQAVMQEAAFAPFAAAIDMGTLRMRHTPVLWQMGD